MYSLCRVLQVLTFYDFSFLSKVVGSRNWRTDGWKHLFYMHVVYPILILHVYSIALPCPRQKILELSLQYFPFIFTERCYTERGIAAASRPSVRDVEVLWSHIGWNSSKIISLLVSLGCSLSAEPNVMDLHVFQGEHHKIFTDIGWGTEKWLSA